jgi:AP-1 complex subunit mu
MEYIVKAKTNFRNKSVANNVDIYIPVPNDIKSPQFKAIQGTTKYIPDQDHILWNIKQFQGQTELNMRASFNVPTIRILDTEKFLKKPIIVKFEIPYFTISGIQVRYLKVSEKSDYKALPWVRYITQNGEYHIRMI